MAIACLCSSPAISHLAGEPDPALLVPTDNWTNRSHSLRANYSSLFLPAFLSSFLLSPFSFLLLLLVVPSPFIFLRFFFSFFLLLPQRFTWTLFPSPFMHNAHRVVSSPLLVHFSSSSFVSILLFIILFSIYFFPKWSFPRNSTSYKHLQQKFVWYHEWVAFDNCGKRSNLYYNNIVHIFRDYNSWY